MATLSTASAALDSDILYEVVNGEVVEIPPMSAYATLVASLMLQALGGQQKQGRVVAEMLFDLSPAVGSKRRPDLAFVSNSRWVREKPVPDTETWNVVPNLAVEVISPSNIARDMLDKVAEYFQAGVERVWVVYPSHRQIYIYASPTDVRILSGSDELVDDTLFPGFRLLLGTLFDDTGAGKP